MKKSIAVISAVCALSLLLSSCGIITINVGKDTEEAETDGKVTETEKGTEYDYSSYEKYEYVDDEESCLKALDELDSANLGGQSVFFSVSDDLDTSFSETDGYYSADVYKRNRAIETKYNVKVLSSYYQAGTVYSSMKSADKSGDFFTDFAVIPMSDAYSFLSSDFLGNINTLPYFNIEGEGVNQAATKMLCFGLNQYGVVTKANGSYENLSCVYVNLNMLEKSGITFDYSVITSGGFTSERYLELLKDVSLCSSFEDEEFYASVYFGMNGYFTDDAKSLSTPDNIKSIVDTVKKIVANMESATVIPYNEIKKEDLPTAESTSSETTDGEGETVEETTANQDKEIYGFDLFRYGKAGVAIGTLGDIRKLGQTGFKWEVLPLPKMNEEQENYISYLSTSSSIIVSSKNSDNIDAMSYVLNGLAVSSGSWIMNNYLDGVQRDYVTSNKTLDMIDLITANPKYDFAVMLSGSNSVNNATMSALVKAVTTKSSYSTIQSQYSKKYANIIKSLK